MHPSSASNRLLILTATYPYGAGEGFLTSEFSSLSTLAKNIIIVPLRKYGHIRSVKSLPVESNISYEIVALFGISVFLSLFRVILRRPKDILNILKKVVKNTKFSIAVKNIAVIPKSIWLSEVCIDQQITHIHVHWASTTATCAMVASELTGIPWSLTCHRWDIYENNLLAQKSRSAKFIRFISKRGAQDGISRGVLAEKICVIRMGVNVPSSRPIVKRKLGTLRIACAANLIPVKGHSYLLDAANLLNKLGVKFTIAIIGDGELKDQLRLKVKKYFLERQVFFLGQLNHSDLMKMYGESSFDLFVLPSVELDAGVHEGIPVSLMEAMAHGIPVVSTKSGSIPELLNDDLKCTVPDKDAFALSSVIEDISKSDARWEELARQHWEIIKEWSNNKVAIQLIEKINDI